MVVVPRLYSSLLWGFARSGQPVPVVFPSEVTVSPPPYPLSTLYRRKVIDREERSFESSTLEQRNDCLGCGHPSFSLYPLPPRPYS